MERTPSGRRTRVPGIAPPNMNLRKRKAETSAEKTYERNKGGRQKCQPSSSNVDAENSFPNVSVEDARAKLAFYAKVIEKSETLVDKPKAKSQNLKSARESEPPVEQPDPIFESLKPVIYTGKTPKNYAAHINHSKKYEEKDDEEGEEDEDEEEEEEEEEEREGVDNEESDSDIRNDDQQVIPIHNLAVGPNIRFANVNQLQKNLDKTISDGYLNVSEAILFTLEFEQGNIESDAHVQSFIKRNANGIDCFASNEMNGVPMEQKLEFIRRQQVLMGNVLLQKIKCSKVRIERSETVTVERLEDTYRWNELLPPVTDYEILPPHKIPTEKMKTWRPDRDDFFGCIEDYMDHFNRNATDPVEKTQDYSGSKRTPATKFNLKAYPSEVRRYLRDSIEHTFKFRRAEFSMTREELQNNSFYIRFGNNDETRWENLNHMKKCITDFETKGFDATLVNVMNNIRRCVLKNGVLVRQA